jgi:hypothetical protein
MHLCEEFRKHADDCRQTARTIKDPAAKAIWSAMADRWARAAQVHSHDEQQVDALRRARVSRRNSLHSANGAAA